MKKTVIIAALAATVAAPAFANDQLALSLGVEPGVYTTAELATLSGIAGDDTGNARVQFIDRNGPVMSSKSVGSGDTYQLARSVGVEPGDFSVNELARIAGAASAETTQDRNVFFDDDAGNSALRDFVFEKLNGTLSEGEKGA